MNPIEKEILEIELPKIMDANIDNCRIIYRLAELQFQAYERAFSETTFNKVEKNNMIERFPESINNIITEYKPTIIMSNDLRLYFDFLTTSFVIKLKNI